MKRNHFRRHINKTLQKLAKLNLINSFNKSVVKPITSHIRTEFKNVYRDKIKAEYHYSTVPPMVMTGTTASSKGLQPYNIEPEVVVETNNRTKCIELAFNYMEHPTLRDQIEVISQVHHCHQLTETRRPYSKRNIEISSDQHHRIISMSAGKYLHMGVRDGLKRTVHLKSTGQQIHLSVAMYLMHSITADGLKIPRYFAIFGRAVNANETRIPGQGESFLIGIYEGTFPEPTIANEILRPFVDEMKEIAALNDRIGVPLNEDGLMTKIVLHSIVCDPVANSFLTCTVLPNGVYGCCKCRQRSQLQFNKNRTSFPAYCRSETLRLDEDFQYCLDRNYHLGVPIILELDVRLITQVSIDYRHTILLGAMKRLIELWTVGKLDHRINNEGIRKIDDFLDTVMIPKEFLSKPKKITDRSNWSLYDWKQFLLYFGPVILRDILPMKYYINFLYLHLGLRVMLNPDDHNKCSAFISGLLLKRFVLEYSFLYGSDQVDYNIHHLLHFEDTINRYGSLECVSGTPFEKCFDQIQAIISNGDNDTLEGIANQIIASQDQQFYEHHQQNQQIKIDNKFNIILNGFKINNQYPDNFVITSNGPVKVRGVFVDDITGESVVIGQRFKDSVLMYHAPITNQRIYFAFEANEMEKIEIESIMLKAYSFETDRGLFIMPILRS